MTPSAWLIVALVAAGCVMGLILGFPLLGVIGGFGAAAGLIFWLGDPK